MAQDGDRHQLGDPITRMINSAEDRPPSVLDETPVHALTGRELHREIANLDVIVREAADRGIPPDTLALVRRRLVALRVEFLRRGETSDEPGPPTGPR